MKCKLEITGKQISEQEEEETPTISIEPVNQKSFQHVPEKETSLITTDRREDRSPINDSLLGPDVMPS